MVELSVVIPAYREEAGLAQCLERVRSTLEALGMDFEIIVIDDGSPDATYAVVMAQHRRDRRVKGLRLSRNFGKEAALFAGLKHAAGNAVITMDADLQHPPEAIPELVRAWREGALIVNAVKRDRRVDPLWRRFIARAFSRLLSRMAGVDLRDGSDFKLLDAEVVAILLQQFGERDRFFRGLTAWLGFPQQSVAFDVQPRIAGRSRWGRIGLAGYALRMITAFSSLPLAVVPALGLVMLVIALLLGSEALYSRLSGRAVSGFATLEMTLLFTGSLIMIGLGVIGQYLAHIFDELKRRPVFLVQHSVGFEAAKPDQARRPETG